MGLFAFGVFACLSDEPSFLVGTWYFTGKLGTLNSNVFGGPLEH